MQSIKKFFSPKKDNDDSDFKLKRSKSGTKCNESLLKVVDNEDEDITGLLFNCNEQPTAEEFTESSDQKEENQPAFLDAEEFTESSDQKEENQPEFLDADSSPNENGVSKIYEAEKKPAVQSPNKSEEVIVIEDKSPVSNPQDKSPVSNLQDKSPVLSRSRRFSFNIKSPNRTPHKNTLTLKIQIPGCSFDEALNMTENNSWDLKKDDSDSDLRHPKKRFKTESSTSEQDASSSVNITPFPKLVAKKLIIPCLQPPSAFANPPKNKEFYNLRQSISNSRQKNYVIMSRACTKQDLRPVYYEIEKILTHKITTNAQAVKHYQFLVKWSDFSEKYTSWEGEEHFTCSPHLLLTYITQLLVTVDKNSVITEDLKAINGRLKKRIQKISAVKSQVYLWQLNAELSTQAFKQQYKRLLRQYSNKVQEELGPSFPTLQIINTVDFNLPPLNFTFVRDRFAGKGVHISDDTLIGCVCSGQHGVRDCCLSPDVECCPHLGGATPPYNNKGRLVLKQGSPIYECNARCSCGPDCGNRIVQRGTQVKTAIYKTPDKGWGLKTLQNIPRGTFVVEYVGEVITFDEAEQRGKEYDAQGLTYLFDLDYQTNEAEGLEVDEGMFTIDAAFYGNTSHFINHSCDPNLAVFSCWISNLDIRLPHICLFAVKSITAGEELTFNYQIDRIVEEDNRAAQRLSVECRCGTKKCVRYLHG